jgi:hypothetical protein
MRVSNPQNSLSVIVLPNCRFVPFLQLGELVRVRQLIAAVNRILQKLANEIGFHQAASLTWEQCVTWRRESPFG